MLVETRYMEIEEEFDTHALVSNCLGHYLVLNPQRSTRSCQAPNPQTYYQLRPSLMRQLRSS